MIAWFDVAWGAPKLHEEKDEEVGAPFLLSDPVLVVTKDGEMLVAVYERDPDTGFDGWIEPKSSWVLEDVTHWAPLPKGPGK